MYSNLQTFGEFLNSILQRKRLTVTALAQLTETKSRNSIQRLLKDECSLEVINNFKAKLIAISPALLSEEEVLALESSIEVNRYGKSKLYARDILFYLSQDKEIKDSIHVNHVYGSVKNHPKTLYQLFQTYQNYLEVQIIIMNICSSELTQAIKSFLTSSLADHISIEHMINTNLDPAANADIFSYIYKLINYKYYTAYYTDTPYDFSSSNCIVVHGVSQSGNHYTDLIKLDEKHQYNLLYKNPGDQLYQFYLSYFESVKAGCQRVKRIYPDSNPIEMLIDLYQYLCDLEKVSDSYLVKQNLCFQMIPVDILYQMLSDSNFFGLLEESPMIQRLIHTAKERFYNYYYSGLGRYHLFTRRGFIDFIKCRTLSDHYYMFREFTAQETKDILSFIIDQLKSNDHFKIYLLKDDYKIDFIEYIYYKDRVVYLFDSCSGYDENLDEGIITAKPFLDIFDDFILNELIVKHTYPDNETIRFLEEVMARIAAIDGVEFVEEGLVIK